MTRGLARGPMYVTGTDERWTGRHNESALALHELLKHDVWIESHLKVGTPDQFAAKPDDLQARHDQLERSRAASHARDRGMHQIGILLVGTVAEMQAEFSRQTVLDIGCGTGMLGTELSRKANAKVTFLDREAGAMSSIPPRAGKKVVADGANLPFKDETFGKTVSSFSSITWAETPLETVQALHEALRVTKVGGSLLAPAIMSNITARDIQSRIASIGGIPASYAKRYPEDALEDARAMKVWDAQDHSLLHGLLTLIEEGCCDVTWSGYLATGQTTNASLETYSVIIDKKDTIPGAITDQNLEYAARFMA